MLKSKKFSYLWDYVLSQTKILQDFEKENHWHFSTGTYVNWALNHRTAFPCCKTCGKMFNYCNVNWNGNYPMYCSHFCLNKSPEHIQKVADTLEKHYGVRVPAKSPIVLARMEATNLQLYGVTNCWNQPHAIEKAKSKESIEKRLNSLSSYNM